ncbi:MAG: acetate/propionate family kinase, partial [Halothece sp.]
QVAIFDTAFHNQMPIEAKIYPIPYEFYEKGIRRYGFHGISHQYCLQRVAQLLGKDEKDLRVITCHLGNGCSLAAIKNGISINTTMGYTPLEGLMMGSRSGSIDPSIVIELYKKGYESNDIKTLLNKQSGVKGLSGLSGDMRELTQAIDTGNEQAKLAFDVYIHRLRYYIGAMLTSLGGLDILVFTGGVGEHRSNVRKEACNALGFMGLEIDEQKNDNASDDTDVATENSSIRVFMIKTKESWQMAKECWQICQA